MPAIRVRDLRKSYGTIEALLPARQCPRVADTAKLFPMQQLADGLQYAFDPRTAGLGFNGGDPWRLLAWTVAGSLLAVRLFRWDSVKK